MNIFDQQRQHWVSVVNAGDLNGYALLLTEDAVWIPPSQPAINGREEFRKWLEPFFNKFDYELSFSEIKNREAGSWAVEQGCFTSRMSPKDGGEQMEHSGSYIVSWRQENDGIWRIERYVDTTES